MADAQPDGLGVGIEQVVDRVGCLPAMPDRRLDRLVEMFGPGFLSRARSSSPRSRLVAAPAAWPRRRSSLVRRCFRGFSVDIQRTSVGGATADPSRQRRRGVAAVCLHCGNVEVPSPARAPCR